ncbi:hypothetical protein C8J57DRAFT_1713226 [Mycena rebaudengoi]|nr:hypothetical protein C8J57DRAFT_1713226 [Mycena rebaudengoi]
MPLLHHTDSDTTHVSDSEPEQEARRYVRDNSDRSSPDSSAPNSPRRTPLSAISNTVVDTEPSSRRALDSRLSAIEGDIAEIKDALKALRCRKRNRASPVGGSPPSTPLPKRARIMRDKAVGPNSPVGRLEEPRIHRSSLMVSTPEREEIGRCLDESLQQTSAPRTILLGLPPVAVTATAVDLRPVEWSKNILTGRDGQRHGRTGC